MTAIIRAHIVAKPEDCERCKAGTLSTPCNICDGGLALCTVCGGAEGSLSSHCAGEQLTEDQLERIYEGSIDYKHGEWISPGVPPWQRATECM